MQKSEQRTRILAKIPWADQPVWRSIDCEDGWLNIVECLVDLAISLNVKVTQIKEKFGGLRFYYTPANDVDHRFNVAVRAFELLARCTCEVCGDQDYEYDQTQEKTVPTSVLCTTGGWLKTLCPACASKLNYTPVRSMP